MPNANEPYSARRQGYLKDLREARDRFLHIFYDKHDTGVKVTTLDLLSVIVVQNMEIKELLKNGNNGNLPTLTKGKDG